MATRLKDVGRFAALVEHNGGDSGSIDSYQAIPHAGLWSRLYGKGWSTHLRVFKTERRLLVLPLEIRALVV